MDVPGLQEGKEYMFRVKAVNDEGESEPLETDHAVLAKDPYSESLNPCIFFPFPMLFVCFSSHFLLFIFSSLAYQFSSLSSAYLLFSFF